MYRGSNWYLKHEQEASVPEAIIRVVGVTDRVKVRASAWLPQSRQGMSRWMFADDGDLFCALHEIPRTGERKSDNS
jgi:hypothetical protein